MTAVPPGPWKHTFEQILSSNPRKLILGLNYSGIHDTAIALVESTGRILLACSLERFSRAKQDGRPPDLLLEGMPWEQIETVAVATEEAPRPPENTRSLLHPQPLVAPRSDFLEHGPPFYDYLARLPAPKEFVCHYQSHAASAFWPSGFDEALCLTYDGGMCNSPWFGGLYRASRRRGIQPLDRFAGSHYAKITSLYSVVTALLGFSPNKHEGKITGLASYAAPSTRCRAILEKLFTADYLRMESLVEWFHIYSKTLSPVLVVNATRREELLEEFEGISREEIAATLQAMTEEHVLTILKYAFEQGWRSENICLSGGLFANVKVNQRVKDFGFKGVFVSPPMTDDGSALGAALAVVRNRGFSPERISSVYLGPLFPSSEIENTLLQHQLSYRRENDPARSIAEKLAQGRIVGVFQGRMEFGPRALGNRSILSQATDPEINKTLNARLRRTEFMPFAPITRLEDISECYIGLDGAEHTAEFMTITCLCTEQMRRQAPAVVHLDNTARPQIVRPEVHGLLHQILTEYKKRTGIPSLINTSFNVHEEPIVCSPADAIRGFLETGIDDLYLEGGYMVSSEDNIAQAYEFLRKRLAQPSIKETQLAAINMHLDRVAADRLAFVHAAQAEAEIQRAEAEIQRKAAEERLAIAIEKEAVIFSLSAELQKSDAVFAVLQSEGPDAESWLKKLAKLTWLTTEERINRIQELRVRDGRIQKLQQELASRNADLEKSIAALNKAEIQLRIHEDNIALQDTQIADLQYVAQERLLTLEKVHAEAERSRNEWAAALNGRDRQITAMGPTIEEHTAVQKSLELETLRIQLQTATEELRVRNQQIAELKERETLLRHAQDQSRRDSEEIRLKDEKVAELQNTAAERLLALKQLHIEAEKSRNEWAAALKARDERIVSLDEHVAAMERTTDERIAELKRLANERLLMLQGIHLQAEQEQQKLMAALKSREECIADLERVAEQRLAMLENVHAEAERARQEVIVAIQNRDKRIAELERAATRVHGRTEHVKKLHS
jgi:carbamoyltransferase